MNANIKVFARRYHIAILLILMFLFFLWWTLPAPYGVGYLVKRALFRPTYLCMDYTYSFATTPKGACSSHGGLRKVIRDEETQ